MNLIKKHKGDKETMKKIKLIVILTMFALSTGARKKEGPKPSNTTTANTASANLAPAMSPAPAAAKAHPQPVSTESGDHLYTHAASGLQFEAPPSWEAEADGDMMTLTSADGTLSVIFWVTEEDTVKESLNALDEEFDKIMKNMKPSGEPQKGMLNGLTVYSVNGTGEVDGVAIEWSAVLIEAKKPVIALSFAAPGAYEEHQKELAAFVKSIKKVN